MEKVQIKKDCRNCKYFRNSEEVFDGYIEHRNPKTGEVWLKEPKSKKLPLRCIKNLETFNSWWDLVKNTPSSEIKEVNCNDFIMSEDFKKFHLPLIGMIELSKKILESHDKS